VHPSLPVKSLKELIALAKAKSGQMSYSTSGIYGALHMPMEMFLHAANLKMRAVHTNGGGPAITILLGGHVEMTVGGPAAIASHVKAGRLRPIVGWGAKRHEAFPQVPTFKELGYDIEYYIWAGVFAPKGTPEPVMKTVRDACAQSGRRSRLQGDDAEDRLADSIPGRAGICQVLGQRREAARGSRQSRRPRRRPQVRLRAAKPSAQLAQRRAACAAMRSPAWC
jgi:tripartite-type tricarboxylate transporter receptor subunit TctC